MQKKKQLPLAAKIFIGLILGILTGVCLMGNPDIATQYIKPLGTLFLNLIKFIVVPIVLFSIMTGVISMKDIRKVGKIGIKTVVFYMCTTAFAVLFGLVIANLSKSLFSQLSTTDLSYTAQEAPSLMETFVNMFPSNILQPMLEGNMLQVIVIALFFGFGILAVGKQGKAFADFAQSANAVAMAIMDAIIRLSPIGVFCLIAPVVAENGAGILGNLATVLLVAYAGYVVHMAVVYSFAVRTFAGIHPLVFFKTMMPAMMMAFSSASSVGSLPLNLEGVESLGGKKEIASFVLPLGATLNMDGTAIYQGVCAIFIAACYQIDLTLGQQITIILTATLASIGTAGVPGAGMVMLAMVLQSANLPLEGIALVAGIDRIFDMGRTVVNITGDATCALVVSKSDQKNKATS